MQNDATTRYCPKCDQRLPWSEFSKNQGYCKSCMAAYQRQYKAKHKKPAKSKVAKPKTPTAKPKSKTPRRELTPEERRNLADHSLRHHWGIGIDEIEMLAAERGNLCSSCGEPQTALKPYLTPYGDTKTKTIYGFLCTHCNSLRYAIPVMDQRPDKLQKIRDYLASDPAPIETSHSASTSRN